MFIGELQKQFIESLKKDLTRLTNRSWDEYSAKILEQSNGIERAWLRYQVKKLSIERLKVIGATMELDLDAGEEMLGIPDYKRTAARNNPPMPQQLQTLSQTLSQAQVQQAYQQSQLQALSQAQAQSMLGGGLGNPNPLSSILGRNP